MDHAALPGATRRNGVAASGSIRCHPIPAPTPPRDGCVHGAHHGLIRRCVHERVREGGQRGAPAQGSLGGYGGLCADLAGPRVPGSPPGARMAHLGVDNRILRDPVCGGIAEVPVRCLSAAGRDGRLCDRLGGRLSHHRPSSTPRPGSEQGSNSGRSGISGSTSR